MERLTNWTTALWGKISSEQVAWCGRETYRGFQVIVGSATTEITFILRNFAIRLQCTTLLCKSSRCKSYYADKSTLLYLRNARLHHVGNKIKRAK